MNLQNESAGWSNQGNVEPHRETLILDRGRYEILNTIATTPWSRVCEVFDTVKQRRFAAKLLSCDGPLPQTARAMWERERAALDGLNHAAIVHLDRWFQDGQKLVLVLELIRGGKTLSNLISECASGQSARPTPYWRIREAVSLISALAACHARDVVHRDLKPGNVLVAAGTEADEASLKLADFGVSLVLPLAARNPGGATLREFHTRPFAAPEQLLQKPVSAAADVHAFAILCAVLLALKPVEEDAGASDARALLQSVQAEYLAAGASPRCIAEFGDLVFKALAENASERPRLPELERALKNLAAELRPTEVAGVRATVKVSEGLGSKGFRDFGALLADLNDGLNVSAKATERGLVIDCYGRTAFARLMLDGPNKPLVMVDMQRKSLQQHDFERRSAKACPIELVQRSVPGEILIQFADSARADERGRASDELLNCAEKVVRFEQDRLARLVAEYNLGAVRDTEEGFLQARAAGLSATTQDRVSVEGLVEFPLIDLRPWSMRGTPEARKEAETQTGIAAVEAPSAEVMARIEQLAPFFERPQDVTLKIKDNGRLTAIGSAVSFDEERQVLQARIDKKISVRRVGELQLINDQQDKLLQKQKAALECLKAGGAARKDLSQLLYDTNAHQHGEAFPISLIQQGLIGAEELALLVQNILSAQGLFLVQGPPGAGKTTLITEVVLQALQRNPNLRIGVVSQANEAVANVFEGLRKVMAKTGHKYMLCRDVRDELAKEEGEHSGRDAARKAFTSETLRSLRERSPKDVGLTPQAMLHWQEALENGSHGIRDDHAALVQAWCVTLMRAPTCLDFAQAENFDLLIVDEAAKATVAETMVCLVRAKRVLMVGDHRQLPPYLDSTTEKELEQGGIKPELAKRSLFEHLMGVVPKHHRSVLTTQFRMYRTIARFVRELFYPDIDLKTGVSDDKRQLPPGFFAREERVFHVNVRGEEKKAGKTTLMNEREIAAVMKVLDRLDRDAHGIAEPLTVAVMAAYKGQVRALSSRLSHRKWKNLTVKCATVDAYQGREADVVIYSTVRTKPTEWKFIGDNRRLNVAFSRPKRLLVLIGHRDSARETPLLREAIDRIVPENRVEEGDLK